MFSMTTGMSGHADGGPQQLQRPLLGDPLGHVGPGGGREGGDDLRAGGVPDQVDHQEAGVAAAVEPEEPAHQRVRHVVHALVPVRQERPEIGQRAEVDGDAVRQQAVAAHADAEPLPDRAAVTVGRDDVLRAHRALRPALEVADDRRDAVRVLLQRRALVAVPQPRAEFGGPDAQDGLERVLVDEQPYRRAELVDPGVQVREVVGDLAAGQRLDVVDPAVRRVLLLGFAPDRVLEPGRAQDLHRAEVEVSGPGVDRGARVPLDRQHVDSVMAQEQRGRQADQAAADDQYGHILTGSAVHRKTSRQSAMWCVRC
jgi:hypothetical protein